MRKIIFAGLAAILLLAACGSDQKTDSGTTAGAEIVIAKESLKYFIGTFDEVSGSFTAFDISGWNELEPMEYINKIGEFPDEQGKFFGLPPWYTYMAQATLEISDEGIIYASLVDVKSRQKVSAIMTKWKVEGENIRLMCVGENFPNLDAAVNLDGSYLFPDSSRFIMARSGGGDMEKVWRRYMYILDKGDCQWETIYDFESARYPAKETFVEGLCQLQTPIVNDYLVFVQKFNYGATGEFNGDGSMIHEIFTIDSSYVNLWELAQKMKSK
ncbi:MAG: hypothetical protein ABIE07_11995 [Candidatus Zixiibacteriota bacterium]